MPKLLGIEGKPAMRDDGIFTPHEAYGMKVMSIGSMLEGDQAVVWRGPMATSALRQLVRETDWGEIDTLVIDLPPGTGDVHISLVQTVPLTGAIVVSTPQDLALIDAKKAIDMFKRTNVPILGIVENMSYFLCPSCGETVRHFRHWRGSRSRQTSWRQVPRRHTHYIWTFANAQTLAHPLWPPRRKVMRRRLI